MCSPACLLFAVLAFSSTTCSSSDSLALLTGTLKTMRRAACDDELVSLSCPRGTTVNIQVAEYGKATAGAHSCKPRDDQMQVVSDEQCLWPTAMQYSLLQTVVEACRKKPHCTFSTKSKPGTVDPCPHTRKFVDVAFKCRPHEFRSQTACEDEVIRLSCNPHSRVVIFDAMYGRKAYESIICPQTQGVADETCTAQYAVETVMQLCHGKRRCQVVANSKTFGTPCRPETKSYLKVVYTCVPLGVLMEKFESPAEADEKDGTEKEEGLFDETVDHGEKWREPNQIAPVANPALQPPEKKEDSKTEVKNVYPVSNHKAPPSNASETQKYIYISIVILLIIIVLSIIIGIRYYRRWKQERASKNGNMFSTEAPNVFNDTLSDIDNDVDVSHISGTFYDPLHPDMILYKDGPGRTTLRAMKPLSTIYPTAGPCMYGNVDYVPSHSRDVPRFIAKEAEGEVMMSPKSLSGYSNSQFYYG
ncbi:protein eva-1 homolog C-like [Aricia agestis]|uniref:protein eva-1 homolog C-like n=1 Tax=Aricia agestis TaxID=91739 RepID=UPI001C2020FC|nr:protein eva-1 homolog C-like [Aricia agestis]